MSGWPNPQPEGVLVRLRAPAAGDEPALVKMATDARVRRYIGGPVDEAIATIGVRAGSRRPLIL